MWQQTVVRDFVVLKTPSLFEKGMPHAVTLPLDDAVTFDVQRMLVALADHAVADDVIRLGYRPHVTLAIMPNTAPVTDIEEATFRIAAKWASFPMILAAKWARSGF